MNKKIEKNINKKEYEIPNTGNDFKDTLKYIGNYFKRRGLIGFLKDVFKDLFLGRTKFNWIYLILLTMLPVAIQMKQLQNVGEVSVLSFITAVTGIMCVIYVREGRLSNYILGLINSTIYLCLSLNPINFFLGEALTALFWTIMNIVGPFFWINGYRKKEIEIKERKVKKEEIKFVSKKLTKKGWFISILAFMVYTLAVGTGLKFFNSNKPYLDASTNAANVVGQFLMNGQYAGQWVFWIVVNILSIPLWAGNDMYIVMMYVAQLINSIVGWIEWELEARGKTWKDILPKKNLNR